MSEGTRIAFIAGVGFSGSTLLAFLLNSHPRIVSPGEMTGPARARPGGDYPCSCGAPLAECAFWQAVRSAMAHRGHELDLSAWDVRFDIGSPAAVRFLLSRSLRSRMLDGARDRIVRGLPPWNSSLRRLELRNRALAESIVEVSKRQVLVDASKHPIRARFLARVPGIDLQVIHLVRDSPGLVSSRMANQAYSLDSSIRFWNRGAAQVEQVFASLPGVQRLRVRYEDLCRDPAGELQKITDFLGLEPHAELSKWRSYEHHIVGNRMRLEGSNEIRLDLRWKERLSREQLDRVLRRTRRFRRRFGYASEMPRPSSRDR